jgi:RNA polymerase sigma-70 factor (ECF subfamily)
MMVDAHTAPLENETALDRLGRLFDEQHQRIYRLARRLTRDHEEARDLVQETFLRAARHAHRRPESRPAAEAWLVRTTVNLCRDLGRRRAVRTRDQHKIEPPAPFGPNPETATVARTSVEAALAGLAPRRRAVIVLVEIEGLSTPEVAQLLDIPNGTVRWHLSRGKKELRCRLASGLSSQEIST